MGYQEVRGQGALVHCLSLVSPHLSNCDNHKGVRGQRSRRVRAWWLTDSSNTNGELKSSWHTHTYKRSPLGFLGQVIVACADTIYSIMKAAILGDSCHCGEEKRVSISNSHIMPCNRVHVKTFHSRGTSVVLEFGLTNKQTLQG